MTKRAKPVSRPGRGEIFQTIGTKEGTVLSLDDAVAGQWEALGPGERRVARFFQENREDLLINSAAQIAADAGTSDATVVRTAKALGFSGLPELRRSVADGLRRSLSQVDRLQKTISRFGGEDVLSKTIELHLKAIGDIPKSIPPALFDRAVTLLCKAESVQVFGIGPSSAVADYLAIQLARLGIASGTLTNTGLLLADDLQRLRRGDCVVILAYSRVYAELEVLLDRVAAMKLKAILVTDSLADLLRRQVDTVLPVARGHAELLSMHTATLALVDSLLIGVATVRPRQSMQSLSRLNEAREKLAGKGMAVRPRRK